MVTAQPDPAALGRRIAALRRSHGLSQRRLAEAAGVSHGYIAQLELGRLPSPGKFRLDAVARALDLRTSDALLGPGDDAFGLDPDSLADPRAAPLSPYVGSIGHRRRGAHASAPDRLGQPATPSPGGDGARLAVPGDAAAGTTLRPDARLGSTVPRAAGRGGAAVADVRPARGAGGPERSAADTQLTPAAHDAYAAARGQSAAVARPAAGDATAVRETALSADVNVAGALDQLRSAGARPLPIFRWGSCGDPRDRESPPDPDRLEFPPPGREMLIGPNGFGVVVKGDSMAGRGIHDGDVVWVNPDRPYQIGKVVLALASDASGESGMVVKTYGRTDVGACLLSEPEPGLRSTVVCQQFHVVGPVVGITSWRLPT